MSGDELVDQSGRGIRECVRATTIARQLVTGQLLADDPVQRPIGIESTNDIVNAYALRAAVILRNFAD